MGCTGSAAGCLTGGVGCSVRVVVAAAAVVAVTVVGCTSCISFIFHQKHQLFGYYEGLCNVRILPSIYYTTNEQPF